MKSYIVDTLCGIFALDESGNIVSFRDFDDDDQKILDFYETLEKGLLLKEYEDLLSELKLAGFSEYAFDNKNIELLTSEKLGYKTFLESESLEFKNFRLNLTEQLKKIGLSKSRNDILAKYKRINEELIRKKVSQIGGQSDLTIIQIIETLEILKKSINLFSMRLREWYGLHFPELTDKVISDDILLAKMISILGNRENYTIKNIRDKFSLNENLIENIFIRASQSMGADIDLTMVKGYSNQILSLDSYRKDLEGHLDDLIEKTAPNLRALVGPLIGAKLIAKAGSLKRLAFMPASRIQLLGAERALYRFLKTGGKDKRPKHGLIFQWNQIRSSNVNIRGNISRLISGKIGIASKVDYFGGEFIGDVLTQKVIEKIEEIKRKHPKYPKKIQPKRGKQKRKNQKKRKK